MHTYALEWLAFVIIIHKIYKHLWEWPCACPWGIMLIEIGRPLSLDFGQDHYEGNRSWILNRGENEFNTCLPSFLFPDCKCDVISCFTLLLHWFPCHDGLYLGLWTRINSVPFKCVCQGTSLQQWKRNWYRHQTYTYTSCIHTQNWKLKMYHYYFSHKVILL